jgi:hypothetical protein
MLAAVPGRQDERIEQLTALLPPRRPIAIPQFLRQLVAVGNPHAPLQAGRHGILAVGTNRI